MRQTGPDVELPGGNERRVHGGVFDLDHNWSPPQSEHRMGTNADLRTVVLSSAEVKYVRLI